MTRSDRKLSKRVLAAVADETGQEIHTLPVLYEAIDVDALNTLFQPGTVGHITFEYAGFEVTVAHQGAVTLDELEPEQPRGHIAESATAD